jgi:hypothetical protein
MLPSKALTAAAVPTKLVADIGSKAGHSRSRRAMRIYLSGSGLGYSRIYTPFRTRPFASFGRIAKFQFNLIDNPQEGLFQLF